MTTFKVGDLVCVARWPSGLPKINMNVGVIDEIEGNTAICVGLELDGSNSGLYAVPLDCLKPLESIAWVKAKKACEANLSNMSAALKAREERIRAGEAEIAAKYGVAVETLEGIYREVGKLYE